jgi:hypothetical protein
MILDNKKLDIKQLKENCIEILKTKLFLKRIVSNDKIKIFKKFDEIYSIVTSK